MSEPYFSVITPTYNRANKIGQAIDSVLAQGFKDFEYIIVDDGSTDNTQQAVNSYNDSRIKYFKKKNGERGAARNYGISKSSGRYICYLDSDDIYYENHLEEARKFISNNPGIAFFYQPYEILHISGKKIMQKGFYENNIIERISDNNFLCPIGAFIREDIAKMYLFDEDPKFNIAEDLYVWLKIGVRYGINFSPVYTSCLIQHDDRSMTIIEPQKLVYCTEKLVHLLNEDSEFSKRQDLVASVYASHLSLCALYFSINGEKSRALQFLAKSFIKYLKGVSKKRNLVTLKNILLK